MANKRLTGKPSEWYYLVWMDKGTGRVRVSWHPDKGKLVERASKLYHPDMEPALYAGLGERVPMPPSVKGEDKPKRKRKPKPAPEAVAV